MNDENANIREILANMNSDDFNEEIEELEVFDDSLDVKKPEPVQTEVVEKFEEVKKDETEPVAEEGKVEEFEIPVVEDEPIVEDAPAVDIPEVQSDSRDDGMPSMIKMYGEVLTDKEYITNPAIARDEEINKMILALITPDKSAILVGKPGIGKTALVEGLAYRIHTNTVPAAISGWRIIKINIPALLGKINVNGTEVSKLQLLINEIDNLEKTILFIDEVHLLVSKNGTALDLDFANMLKPYLDRGRILMIGATTSEEYEAYILRDRAFVRRFIKIDIAELTGDNVVKVLLGTIPKFEKKMGVKMGYTDFQQEKLYEWVVRNTVEENRIYEVQNRYPDICLTIISSAFSYALFENSDTVQIKHFYLAMKNTNTIYPDRIKKALDDFKSTFSTWLINEGIDPNLI
ncbi:MAG: AAA family ATPase [Bacilli bacterium]|nr:AAA family ATPase [Bacilli bacterium]